MKHLNILISGKVQGVFFRASTKERADQLGLKGFVRNEPNGDVYMEVEGKPDTLKLFLEWAAKGPERARVGYFDIQEEAVINFTAFEVRR